MSRTNTGRKMNIYVNLLTDQMSPTSNAEMLSRHTNTTHKIVIFITVVTQVSPFTSQNLFSYL
jgi:hypothetical protein